MITAPLLETAGGVSLPSNKDPLLQSEVFSARQATPSVNLPMPPVYGENNIQALIMKPEKQRYQGKQTLFKCLTPKAAAELFPLHRGFNSKTASKDEAILYLHSKLHY